MLIQRYISNLMLRPCLGVLMFLLVVVAVFYSAQLLGRAAADGLPIDAVLAMAGLRLLLYLDVLVPASILLGLVIGLGRLQQANELVALQAMGLSRFEIFRLVAIGVVVLAGLVAVLSMLIRPWGYEQFYRIEAQLAERLDISLVEPGRFQVGNEQWLIYAQSREENRLTNVFVHQRTQDSKSVLTADAMSQFVGGDGLLRLVFEGNISSYSLPQVESMRSAQDLVAGFERLEVVVEPSPPPTRAKIRRAMPTSQLAQASRPIEVAEWQWRWMGPMSVLILALSAFFIARHQPRSHRAWPIFSALLMATVYFSFLGVLVNWVEQGSLSPMPGAFLAPVMLGVGLASLATWRRLRW